MSTILEGEECWELVQGIELEPRSLGVQVVGDGDGVDDPADQADIALRTERAAEIKDWKRRFRKAASMITQSVDDSMVQMLDVHNKNPILIWAALREDYNTVTPAQLAQAVHNFSGYIVTEDDTFLQLKHNFDELLRKVIEQGGAISSVEQLQTLLGALPMKYDILRESFYSMTPAPPISYMWSRLYDIETTQLKREAQSEASGMRGEVLYQTRGRGGNSFRGRGRAGANRGGRAIQVQSESCFRCGETDHWSKECPKKESTCTWCGIVGHIERTCYSKENGSARGSKVGTIRGGRGGSTRGGRGAVRFGEGGEEEVADQGHSEVLMGEVSMGTGNGDGDEREWVCDSGADYHMSGDPTLFSFLENIPSTFYVKQIMGRVAVTQWGTVKLRTDGVDGKKKLLELHEVLFMPGMKVNIFSLQRIRSRGACSFSFQGVPRPEGVVQIFNRVGEQIATMKETSKARPTLICSRLQCTDDVDEGEILGAKGVQMELLHKRLGHTSQSGMERLVREQMVRGLEEGVKGEFGMCRGCKLGRASDIKHPRKDPEFRAKEQLELIHTDIAGPFKPAAIEGRGKYNLVIVDDFSRKAWCIPLKKKSDTATAMKEWIAIHENQSGKRVKNMRSDNGGEYVDAAFEKWLKEHGILHQTIPARSPQCNGVCERMNRTIQDRARSMLVGAGLGGGFWVEAVAAACYIRNRCPVAGLSKTPEELWSGKIPTIKHLRAYGCKAYVSLEKMKRKGKMGVTKWEGVVVGYPATSVGYRVWDPARGKVFNVGVPFLDEDVVPGWWKVPNTAGAIEEEEVFQFPDLDVDSTLQGQQVVDELEVVGEGGEAGLPELVEDSSDDDDDDDVDNIHGGGFDDWGAEDDAPVDPVREGVETVDEVGGEQSTEQPTPVEPRQSSRERRGCHHFATSRCTWLQQSQRR